MVEMRRREDWDDLRQIRDESRETRDEYQWHRVTYRKLSAKLLYHEFKFGRSNVGDRSACWPYFGAASAA
jgi:hypothetical protein